MSNFSIALALTICSLIVVAVVVILLFFLYFSFQLFSCTAHTRRKTHEKTRNSLLQYNFFQILLLLFLYIHAHKQGERDERPLAAQHMLGFNSCCYKSFRLLLSLLLFLLLRWQTYVWTVRHVRSSTLERAQVQVQEQEQRRARVRV